jgi:hypothetical protein
VLSGTLAVTGTISNGDVSGNAIVAGIHNGSKILQGSKGEGLMIFAGAKGIDKTTEMFNDGSDAKIVSKVKDAVTEIYKDGSGHFAGGNIS